MRNALRGRRGGGDNGIVDGNGPNDNYREETEKTHIKQVTFKDFNTLYRGTGPIKKDDGRQLMLSEIKDGYKVEKINSNKVRIILEDKKLKLLFEPEIEVQKPEGINPNGYFTFNMELKKLSMNLRNYMFLEFYKDLDGFGVNDIVLFPSFHKMCKVRKIIKDLKKCKIIMPSNYYETIFKNKKESGIGYLKEYAINLQMENTLPIFIPTCEYHEKSDYSEENKEAGNIKYFVNTHKRKFNEYYGKALKGKKDGIYDSVLGYFIFDNNKKILKMKSKLTTGFYIIWDTDDEEQNGVVELDTVVKYDKSDKNNYIVSKGQAYRYFTLARVAKGVGIILGTTIVVGLIINPATVGLVLGKVFSLNLEGAAIAQAYGTIAAVTAGAVGLNYVAKAKGGGKTFKLKSKNLNRSVKKRKGGGNRKVRKKIKFKKHTTAKLKSRNSNRTFKKGVRKHKFVKHKKIKFKKHKTTKLKSKNLNGTYKRK